MGGRSRRRRPLFLFSGVGHAAVDPLLTTTKAAVVLGLSPRTLESLRVRGGGPIYFQVTPRAIRYRRSELDAWLAARRPNSTADPGPDDGAA